MRYLPNEVKCGCDLLAEGVATNGASTCPSATSTAQKSNTIEKTQQILILSKIVFVEITMDSDDFTTKIRRIPREARI